MARAHTSKKAFGFCLAKPIKFSTGANVPLLHDLATGFAAFFIPVLGLTALLIWGLRVYERHSKNADRVA